MLWPVLLALAYAGPALADTSDFRNGLAPYRFNPPPESLSPAEEGAAQAYESRLKGQLNRLERRQFGADAQEREQLRGTRRELERMERLQNQR